MPIIIKSDNGNANPIDIKTADNASQVRQGHAAANAAIDSLQAARDAYVRDVLAQQAIMDSELQKATNLQPISGGYGRLGSMQVKRD